MKEKRYERKNKRKKRNLKGKKELDNERAESKK